MQYENFELGDVETYSEIVEDTAKHTVDAFERFDYADIVEAIDEAVDGHAVVIFPHYHLKVITSSETDASDVEWQIFVDDNSDIADIHLGLTYAIFRHDVAQRVYELVDE